MLVKGTFCYKYIFRFLSTKLSHLETGNSTADNVEAELNRYIADIQVFPVQDEALGFWMAREHVYPRLALLAEDIVSAPASEAFCERVFSLCGDLTTGKRNRLSKNLERRVFLKMNSVLLKELLI